MLTKNDIDFKLQVVYDSLNSMNLFVDCRRSGISVIDRRLNQKAANYVTGAQSQGRTNQTQTNYTTSGSGTSNHGFVAWQRRQKSLPKQTY